VLLRESNRRLRADAALVGNTVVWGATFVLVKFALADISPLLFLALRFTLASLALLVLFRRRWSARWPEIRAGALIGFFLFSGYVLQTAGLQFTSAPKSAFITGLTCVIVPLLAALVYRIRPQASELLGVAIAVVGLGLMTLTGPLGSVNRGDLLTVGCAVAFAAHIVTLGHYSGKIRFESISVIQVTTAALLAGTLFWWAETQRLVWRPAVVSAILVTGLLATAAAFTIQAWAQRFTSSTRTALLYMLEPVFAWLTSYLLAGEGLAPRGAAGAALILGGVVLVELKPQNPRQHPRNSRSTLPEI
jgi:drug/metabolite transporter (DMT)-like permease